jgi:hypothetical protein
MAKKLLSREAILAANDLPTEDVEVPEWGGAVRVRTLTGAQRDAFEAEIVTTNGRKVERNTYNIRAKLVAASVVGEDGKLLFSRTDVEALGAKSAAALDRVFDAASRLSGISDEDVQELAENLDGIPAGDSASA